MAALLASATLNTHDDPLAVLTAPPPDETAGERSIRLKNEAAARVVSETIDEQIRRDRERLKKGTAGEVRLLLLGQSSSGKSTLQKQFQLLYSPSSLDLERSSWRPVVYMNLVKSIRTILETLEFEYDLEYDAPSETIMPASSSRHSDERPSSGGPSNYERSLNSQEDRGGLDGPSVPSSPDPSHPHQDALKAARQLATLRMRLLPLLSMEGSLAKTIGLGVEVAPGKQEVFARLGWQGVKYTAHKLAYKTYSGINSPIQSFESRDAGNTAISSTTSTASRTEFHHRQTAREEMIRQVAHLLITCKQDVDFLWSHSLVKTMIRKRRLRLEDSSTFFLDNVDRLADEDYSPSDDDILRARLRTMGVVEHLFEVPGTASNKIIKWRLYDVGGARGQRPSWVPYFEDANAIIFLAPISAFDQYLEEDNRTNRVDDSLQLFTLICSNPLLKNVHLVLFLNKCDVLKRKLDLGVRVKKYITSYGDRPNDYANVSSYFKAHFAQVHRKNNVDAKRELYTHLTSVVDTQATRKIIINVRDAIFRDHLKESSML